MNRRPLIAFGLLVTVVAVAIFCVYASGRINDAKAHLEEIRAATARAVSPSKIRRNDEVKSQVGSSLHASKSSPAGNTLASDAWRASSLRHYAAEFRLMYHTFLRRSGLSPAVVDRLADIYAEHEWASAEMGDQPADQSALRQKYDRDFNAAMGSAAFAQWKQYNNAYSLQATPTELAESLIAVGVPLTGEQGDQLADILVRHAMDAKGTINPANEDWSGAITEASTALTPVQLQYLRLVANRRQARAELARAQAVGSSEPASSAKP